MVNGDATFRVVTNNDIYLELVALRKSQETLLKRVAVNTEKISTLSKVSYGTATALVSLAVSLITFYLTTKGAS